MKMADVGHTFKALVSDGREIESTEKFLGPAGIRPKTYGY